MATTDTETLKQTVKELLMETISDRNLLSIEIEEEGNSHANQKELSKYRGRIEAYNTVLAVLKEQEGN